MIKRILFLACLLLLLPVAANAVEMESLCNSAWEGHYFYPANSNGTLEREPVKFDLSFSCMDNILSGRITEPNTFGDNTSANLYANVTVMNMSMNKMDFSKTYDGTAGVGHSVQYSGEFMTNRFVYGIWKIVNKNGSVYSGYFEMHR